MIIPDDLYWITTDPDGRPILARQLGTQETHPPTRSAPASVDYDSDAPEVLIGGEWAKAPSGWSLEDAE